MLSSKPWTFTTYRSVQGREGFPDWLSSIPPRDAQGIRVVLRRLRYLDSDEWNELKPLKGKNLKGVFEIACYFSKIQYRPFGFFGPNQREFTFTNGATHKQGVYKPPNAMQTAADRMKLVMQHRELTRELKLEI